MEYVYEYILDDVLDYFQTASQTVIAPDQHAMIRVSLVVMALFSISMERVTSSSA